LISDSCKVISSIDLASSTDFSRAINGVIDGSYIVAVVDDVTLLIPVRGNTLSGMTYMGVACSFSFTNLSISASISFICALCSMINFSISSFSPFVSAISLVCESFVADNFIYFLKDAMSEYFFLIISSSAFIFEGSYPILRTNSSKDLILLSFAKDDIFSSFSWV
jgi:hypothetical protein